MSAEELELFHLGDHRLFAHLVRGHSPILQRYIARFASNRGDPEELLQETWTAVFHRRSSFRNAGSLQAWILKVCRTVCLARHRRVVREARMLEQWKSTLCLNERVPERISDAIRIQELEDLALDHVMKLPRQQRLSVIVRVMLGVSTAEAARVMQCSEGAVKATLHHALINLRRSTAAHWALLVDRPPESTGSQFPPPLMRGVRDG
jgi:RNA polymerase sigma factor (sigma-70 family)